MPVKFGDKESRFLKYARVGRLAMMDGDDIHVVPMCPVFDAGVFYMGTNAKTRKVRILRERNRATLLVDQYSEDWMRNVAVMMSGAVDILERGPDFERGKKLLEEKFTQ